MRAEDHKKFKELAEKRVNRAIKDLQLIGNLANRSNYSYNEADARKIMKALRDAVEEVKGKFDSGGSAVREPFTLD